jgi:deoxyribodipyrimidine photo-lyase
MQAMLAKGIPTDRMEKFIQELAWRDYWQQKWVVLKDNIDKDLRNPQDQVSHKALPKAIDNANTGIKVIDQAIQSLYDAGYMHNHFRMYTAAIACNIGQSHWKLPAQWMYYHLLDGDWASNALSWQWVAGTNSNKKYIANQANINKYSKTAQHGTYLDVTYDELANMTVPAELQPEVHTVLNPYFPNSDELRLSSDRDLAVYTYYNLDPKWREEEQLDRVFLIEPSVFRTYPVGQNAMCFAVDLARTNIPGIQIYVGEFIDLEAQARDRKIYFKEHPLNQHFSGIEDERDWMFSVKGDFRSFFSFWKKCKKEL